MTQYLISFDDGWMEFPEEDFQAVYDAAHAVMREGKDAGVWVLGAGLTSFEQVSVVGTDGAVSEGPQSGKTSFVGGFCIVDVPSRAEALEWAAKVAGACRCAQEVREIYDDPDA